MREGQKERRRMVDTGRAFQFRHSKSYHAIDPQTMPYPCIGDCQYGFSGTACQELTSDQISGSYGSSSQLWGRNVDESQ